MTTDLKTTPHTITDKAAWQLALANAITKPIDLLNMLDLPSDLANDLATKNFPFFITHSFAHRIQKKNPADPLLRQVLPIDAENKHHHAYTLDPLNEAKANVMPGLLHKYAGRVLLTVVGGCAINCRYCFRRHFPYRENNPSLQQWQDALTYIAKDKSIYEVILSGGDPLLAPDHYLESLIKRINQIKQIKIIRIHSRLPIVLPSRLNASLLNVFKQSTQKIVLVIHCNHAQEINMEVKQALQACQDANIPLFNQSVLLKGVNDDVDTLCALSHKLFDAQVTPYYIHLLDHVQGSAHFAIPDSKAKTLMATLRTRLPGYLVPLCVREIPGALAKVPLTSM